MKFRKKVMITLYARQQKRHRCIEQETARAGWCGRMALKHVYYHMWNESPVQVWCMIQDAQGWCTGMTQSDGMGREVGRGFRMGNTCIPVADSCQCMAKPIQYCKVISLQLKQINLYLKIIYIYIYFFLTHWMASEICPRNEDRKIRLSNNFLWNSFLE